MPPLVSAVLEAVDAYERDLEACLVLNAARNVMSPRARAVLGRPIADADWAGRVRSPEAPYSAASLLAIEETARQLVDRLFGTRYAELRAPTGSLANGLAAAALTEPGDTVLMPPSWAFGHKSMGARGYPGSMGRRVVEMPWDGPAMGPDLDGLRAAVAVERPRLIVLGTSRPLFPEPLAEVAGIAREAGCRLVYDGAHVLGLVAGGAFPNPLRQGFHALCGSTQKTLPGPLGGLIAFTEPSLHEAAARAGDQWLSSYSPSRIAALAYVLAEFAVVGAAYSARVVENARALGAALAASGFRVVAAERGFTATHQVLVDVTGVMAPSDGSARLARAGVLVNEPSRADRRLRGRAEDGLWLRLGTSAVTRLAMGPAEMAEIAAILRRTLLSGDDPSTVRRAVAELRRRHRTVAFTLEAGR